MTRSPMPVTSIANIHAKPSMRIETSSPALVTHAMCSRMTPPLRTCGNSVATRISATPATIADHVDSALRAFVGNNAATTLPMKGSASRSASDMVGKFNEAARCGRVRLASLELRSQQRGRVLQQFFRPRALFPRFQCHAFRAREVRLENLDLPARECGIIDIEIGLVVDRERAAVEIGRADGYPQAIDDEHLAMEHRRLVLGDFNTGTQEVAPARARRAPDRFCVDVLARRDDAYFHAAFCRV